MTTLLYSTSAPDCWADTLGSFNATGTFLWLAGDPDSISVSVRTWLPFVVNLPQGLQITSALIKWVAVENRNDTIHARIGCEAADNPSAPVNDSQLFARTMTAGRTDVDITEHVAGTEYSYDITTAVQEILNRAGWVGGNTLAVMVFDNGTTNDHRQRIAAYEHATYAPASLEITFPTFVPRFAGLI